MEAWKEYKLGEIADIQTGPFGSQLHQRDYVDVGTPCIMPTNIGTRLDIKSDGIAHVRKEDVLRLSKHCVKLGDIIYSRRGDIEKCAFISQNEEGWLCGTGCLRIRINPEKANPHFIAYQLSTKESKSWIVGNAVGTTMLNLNTGILKELPLFIPNKQTQDSVVFVLKSLDDKIEVNKRINDNLEQQAQALFKSWFVDFEPFKDQPFVESELGMIPQGWKVVSLSELMAYSGGSQPPASEFVEEEREGYVRFVQIRDYASDSHKTYIPISKKNKLCDIKDIMIARYGASLGRICFGLKGAYNVALAKVFPKEEYYIEYLRCYLNTRDFYEGINRKGNRAVQAGFNQSDIQSFRIAFPLDQNIVRKFNDICSSYFDERLNIDQESRRLAELRDALLPKLMSGEINVNEISL